MTLGLAGLCSAPEPGRPEPPPDLSEAAPPSADRPGREGDVTLNCLFSSRSRCTSPCSLLHSSVSLLTSVSSKEEPRDLDAAGVSVFGAVVGIILFISTSCCSEINESPSVTNYVLKDFSRAAGRTSARSTRQRPTNAAGVPPTSETDPSIQCPADLTPRTPGLMDRGTQPSAAGTGASKSEIRALCAALAGSCVQNSAYGGCAGTGVVSHNHGHCEDVNVPRPAGGGEASEGLGAAPA